MQVFEDDKQYPVVHSTLTSEEEIPYKERKKKKNERKR